MKRWTALTGVLLAAAVAGTAPTSTAQGLPPAEAFGTIPAESDVVLSGNGRWLAWLDHKEVKPRVIMFDLQGRKVQRILAVPENTKLRSLVWSDDETLLIILSKTHESIYKDEGASEYFRVIAHDVTGGVGRMLPISDESPPRALDAALVAARTAKPKTVLMRTAGITHGCSRCLAEVDTRTGKPTPITFGSELTAGWVVNQAGRAVAREDWDYKTHEYRVLVLEGGAVREILRMADVDHPQLAGLMQDGSALVLLSANGGKHIGAWALPLDGSPMRLLADDPNEDVSEAQYDPNTGTMVGVGLGGLRETVHWIDPAAQSRFDMLQRSFPGRDVSVYGWTADGQKTLAKVQTPSSPPIYYVVDFTAHRAEIAAEEYPALAGVRLGEVKDITYKARDGTAIPAYLTLPADKANGPAPLVVLPHGGPDARDEYRFDWFVQFLSTRGYAVLQPEFRGSIGFGTAFHQAGYRQWGGLMQDDISDGVRSMIDQGIADPRHVCIVGISYGGYAALAGATFTPELYSCAISVSGISDVPALIRGEVDTLGWTVSTALDTLKVRIGDPKDKSLAARSPINAAKAVKAPVLLVYGTGDSVVPTEQSEKMAKALTAAGKSVTTVVLKEEDHWLSRTETRVQVLKEVEKFLKEHL